MKRQDELFLEQLNKTLEEFSVELNEKDRAFLESVKEHMENNGFASHKQKMAVTMIHKKYAMKKSKKAAAS